MSDAIAARWTEARQARLSMGLPRQEYWSGLPFPSLGDLPDTDGTWGLNLDLLHYRQSPILQRIFYRLSHWRSPVLDDPYPDRRL